MMLGTLFTSLCLVGCLHAAVIVDNGLIACDVGQTIYASDDGRWDRPGDAPGTLQRELNPALGPTPAPSFIAVAGLVAMMLTTSVGYSDLPPWLRVLTLTTVGVVEGTLVIEHEKLSGVCGL